eukprot:CAMPEP_0115171396 /NCGR_PEP_ID=MMETSP0270-20121206/2281_1 /TAXON_ID=71861 /ORGANISM="Scrippsiella trochoidea, Strain CCMP3099" /LENGTH=49 /DNA_ID=CAMNT_0002584161 /DNA_START=1195 /DNA_END=1344 /DNA_ORIENTATION=-
MATVLSFITFIFLKAGMYLETGSSKLNLPSSHKAINPAPVIGFVIEKQR